MSDAEPTEPELGADALAMLRAYRAEEQLPEDVHDRVWSRVRADVEPSATRWLRYAAVTGLLAAAAVGVLWMGGQLLRAEPQAPASQAGYRRGGEAPEGTAVPRTPHSATPRGHAGDGPREDPGPTGVGEGATPEAGASAGAGEGGPATGAGDAESDRTTPHAAPSDGDGSPRDAATSHGGSGRRSAADADRRPPPTEPTPAEPTPGSTLADENRLLARARAALIDAEPERALARLDEQARRFPDGVLSEERQALRAVALCEAGRDADGDAAANAFLREHPQAALAQRVRSACLE
jgi:hypothetical protein